ncbi:hypothetical protein BG006_009107 [Podila minutissima]|uniref:Glucose-methanol-choline oxidoreductase N-terminal domain-containing protein n=1 Tax=Podila minutissima TaxID=64525 RepID=A0A9P5VJN8_9FUNG|nr:hypothetical protein BG006_009107 [Podila minutissima]
MDKDSFQAVATTAAVGLGLAGIAMYAIGQRKAKTGREPWNPKTDLTEYDYIIVGGGTCGSVLAARLTEQDPSVSVLILEAGEDRDKSWAVKVPFLIFLMYNSKKHMWGLMSEPQVHANNRILKQVRGKMLGGSSSMSGMMYTRGPKEDYDYWAKEVGDQSWSYKEVLPYFKKSECFHDPSLPADHPLGPRTSRVYQPEYDTFESEYHGTEGPWKVAFHNLYKSAEGFIRANKAMGIRHNPDPNGESILGVCRIQNFIQTNGYRSSSSIAFLGDPKVVPGGGDRGTIRIATKVHVERLLLEKRNGVQTAIGVVFRDERNVLHKVRAKREVLLCAGVFHTPVLLLSSGIGHQIHESIPVVHPLSGVGQNLSDHAGCGIMFKPASESDCHTLHTHLSLKELAKAVYNFVCRGTGPLVSSLAETVTFLRLEDMAPEFVAREKAAGTWQDLSSGPNSPHIELMFSPCYFKASMDGPFPMDSYYAVTPVILNPASRGSVGAKLQPNSAKKGQDELRFDPVVDPNIYSDPFDMRVMKESIRFLRKLAKHMELDPGLGGKEWYPTEAVASNEDDEALEQVIRENTATFFHACGTCKMGPAGDPTTVVNHRLRVHGMDRLRIIDTSIIPKVVAGHTCAAAVMIAEKAADMIREDNTKMSSKEE